MPKGRPRPRSAPRNRDADLRERLESRRPRAPRRTRLARRPPSSALKLTQPVTAVATALLLAACSPPSGGPAARPNVLFVVVDTLRADRLSPWGYAGADAAGEPVETSPFVGELARDAVVFERAWAASSWTAPATASIFTSLYPPQHGVLTGYNLYRTNKYYGSEVKLNRIPPELETLPELMRSLGYRTYGVADNPNVCAQEGFEDGFGRFAQFDYDGAEAVNAALLEWREEIVGGDAPWFVYLHYMDPHEPYHAREPWFGELFGRELEAFGPADPESGLPPPGHLPADGLRARDFYRMLEGAEGEAEVERRLAYARDQFAAAYDSEVRHLDEHLRAAFEALAVDDGTLVVFTSDHGEEFGEHKGLGHPFKLYRELLHVPLLVRPPGPPAWHVPGRRVAADVSAIDLLPTVRELVGAPASEQDQGVSLVGLLRGEQPEPRPIFAMRTQERLLETHELEAVLAGDHKLVLSSQEPEVQLFDVTRDPGEQEDLAAERSERVAELRALLEELEGSLRVWPRAFVEVELDADARAAIERLGYGGDDEDEDEEP